MAISRPFLLALLGIALLAATAVAVQSARDSSADESSPAAQEQPQPAAQPVAQQATPDQTLEAAFSTAKLKSATFDARLALRFRHEAATIALAGAFETTGAGNVPKAAVRLRTHAPGQNDMHGGFVTTGDKAWFVDSGTGYRVPQRAWDLVVKARGNGGGARTRAPLPVNPKTWLRDVKSGGTTEIDGVETEHVSASIDAASAVRDLLKVAQQSGQARALPAGFDKRVGQLVKRADFDVYVGKEDHLLRRFTGNLRLAIPGAGPLDARLRVDLTNVGKPQRIAAPAKTRTGLPENGFGQLSRSVLAGIAGVAGADPSAVRAATANGPRRFKRAFDRHREIVLFFGQSGADDQATASAVQSATRGTRVVVIGDTVDDVDAYGKLVQRLGVDHAPAIVVVDRRGKARLIEGFVDAAVLRQAIADSR